MLPGPSAGLSAPGLAGAIAPNAPAAGMIFGCTNATFDECVQRAVVGLPRKYLQLVQSIVPMQTFVFVFNYSDRHLHGVYLATSRGTENLVPAAWTKAEPGVPPAEGPFPAQCSFSIIEETAPCPEAEFKHVLEYTERQRFRFKLGRWQACELVDVMCRYEAKLRARRLAAPLLDEKAEGTLG